jgi:GMP synthase-like glutamine amidotransferase
MAARGIRAEIAAPADIPSLRDPGEYDVAIILGSDESAYDDSVGWVPDQLDYARRAIQAGVPVLGICFGAQMLARALGGEVRRSPEPEVAWKKMSRAEEGYRRAPG